MSSHYFSQSYREARERFLARVEGHPALDRQWSRSYGEAGGIALQTDAALLRGDPDAKLLLISTSGLHGIEGFAGSAMQLGIIDEFTEKGGAYDLLLIHAVNPFGFHFKRRVNADHIDLNRNALLPGESRENAGYAAIRHLANPGRPLLRRGIRQRWIMARLLLRAMVDRDSVRSAFLGGQFDEPDGPFYGGRETADEVKTVGDWLLELAPRYETFGHLDLHTGYGERGRAHLLCHSEESRDAWSALGFDPEPAAGGADYHMTGNLIGYLEHRLEAAAPELTYRAVLLEFGTMGMELRAQVESMRLMIVDNSMGTMHEPEPDFVEMFNPSSPRWRHESVQEAISVHRRLCESLAPDRAEPVVTGSVESDLS